MKALDGRQEFRARLLALFIAIFTVALTVVPWFCAKSLEGTSQQFGHFLGFTHNVDDNMVYASWIRQYADGATFQKVMFSSEPQEGRVFHLLYFLMGKAAHLTGWQPSTIILLARVLGAMVLFHVLWWILALLMAGLRQRFAAWMMLCFSSGFGWIALFNPKWRLIPVDLTLPDATTFVSIYFGPLQVFPLALMTGALGCMLQAERKSSWRWALAAGGCGLLLGNIHTYDVIPTCLTWAAYVAVQSIRARSIGRGTVLRTALFFAMTALTTGYTGYMLLSDPVYGNRARVDQLSPPIIDLALGYAPLLLLAAAGVLPTLRRGVSAQADAQQRITTDALLLLAVWAGVNLLTSFFPVQFQRKLLLGAHIPLAILSGFAVANFLQRSRMWVFVLSLLAITAVLSISNVVYLCRDVAAVRVDKTTYVNPVRPFIYAGERRALEWLSQNAEPGAVIQPLPWMALFNDHYFAGDATLALVAPSMTGHQVDVAHFCETPEYSKRMGEWGFFQHPVCSNEQRIALLRRARVRYLVTSQKNKPDPLPPNAFAPTFFDAPPPWIQHVPEASNEDADVWRVNLPSE